MPGKCHLIKGRWIDGSGPEFASIEPAIDRVVWTGRAATESEVDDAIHAARSALESWATTKLEDRVGVLHAFADQVESHKAQLIETICRETGKPRWEAATEVSAMVSKIALSIQAYRERRATDTCEIDGARAATRFKPHGVVAVFGPFNLPGHLPNGHIVPALLAGNTVVFKPSEKTPAVGQLTTELWQQAGLPPAALNLVQGGRDTGIALAQHAGLDGIFFTGGCDAGRVLHRTMADRPHKILALEMGGNNPLIVHNVSDLDAAAYLTIESAYITAGQRCTCARRLIVPKGERGDAFIDRLVAMMSKIRVGLHTDEPEPFMGPVIRDDAADRLLDAQSQLLSNGGRSLVEVTVTQGRRALLSPGLIDVTAVNDRADAELFGPLLQLIRVADFDAAIGEANHTCYGLSAGLLCDGRDLYDRFYHGIRAGVVNWNRPTTGASGRLPFGGVGISGNHRPSGYYAADYCSYPVASIEAERLVFPQTPWPGIDL